MPLLPSMNVPLCQAAGECDCVFAKQHAPSLAICQRADGYMLQGSTPQSYDPSAQILYAH